MKNFLLLLMFCSPVNSLAQKGFLGIFKGVYNNEAILLTTALLENNVLEGTLTDATAKYKVRADVQGNRFAGEATHNTVNLVPTILGELNKDELTIILIFTIQGVNNEIKVILTRVIDNESLSNQNNINKVKLPEDAVLDTRIIGTWIKEENYNSGSGDNFMGTSFSQGMTFLSNGTLSETGSSTTISGSNFLGNNESNEVKILEGVIWYTRANQLYLNVTNNGQSQEMHLGKYFIENGNMLITGANGVKLLLHKK